jgi:hypothetical protein
LRSRDGIDFNVPRPLLKKLPRLPSVYPDHTLSLDTNGDVMHVFIHYLFTNTYQCLKPKGISDSERLGVEFSTALGVYTLARKYKILSLEDLAKTEMKRLNDKLPFPVVLSLLQTEYPNLEADDLWVSDLFKTKLTSILQNPSESESQAPETRQKTITVSYLLLKCLKELATDQITPMRNLQATTEAGDAHGCTFITPIPQLVSLRGSPAESYSDTAQSYVEMTELTVPRYTAVTRAVADTTKESNPEQIQSAVEADDVRVVETTYEKSDNISREERELAALERKRRNKISRPIQESRYIVSRPCPRATTEAEAAPVDEGSAEDVAITDSILVETTNNSKEISLNDWSFTDSHEKD